MLCSATVAVFSAPVRHNVSQGGRARATPPSAPSSGTTRGCCPAGITERAFGDLFGRPRLDEWVRNVFIIRWCHLDAYWGVLTQSGVNNAGFFGKGCANPGLRSCGRGRDVRFRVGGGNSGQDGGESAIP